MKARTLVALTFMLSGCSLWLADDVEPPGAKAPPDMMTEPEPEPEPGPWDCVGKLAAIHQDRSRMVDVALHITDLRSDPLANVAVNYCQTLDPGCSPQAQDALTDASGNVTLSVPYGLHGALILKGPADADILPTLVYLEPPPTATSEILVPLLSQLDVQLLSALAMRDVDPNAGLMLLSSPDCSLQYNPLTPGVHYELAGQSPQTVGFYLVNQQPDPNQTQTGPNGVGGYINVPPGLVSVSATLPDEDDLELGHSNFLIRAGWLTYASVSPYDQ